MNAAARAQLAKVRRPVIKIGSAVLTGSNLAEGRTGQRLDRARFAALCDGVAALCLPGGKGPRLWPTVVSSGAVALGVERLGLPGRPKEMALKQAAAAVGQSRLMRLWDDHFEERGLMCAQVLLTHADIAHRGRYLNARRALAELRSRGVVPVINENDTVSVEEIKFGDNDSLAAMVVDLVEADLLVILTDVGGVYTTDPRTDPNAVRLPLIEKVTTSTEALAQQEGESSLGTGGMLSKLKAARHVSEAGVPCAVVPGVPGILQRLLAGDDVGTLILPQGERLGLRKRWMLDLKARGVLRIDDGARLAVLEGKKSLLPSGVREVTGTFCAGDPVDLVGLDGQRVARGLAVYGADEVRRIQGLRSAQIEGALGYRLLDCVVHRDDLVVTA